MVVERLNTSCVLVIYRRIDRIVWFYSVKITENFKPIFLGLDPLMTFERSRSFPRRVRAEQSHTRTCVGYEVRAFGVISKSQNGRKVGKTVKPRVAAACITVNPIDWTKRERDETPATTPDTG